MEKLSVMQCMHACAYLFVMLAIAQAFHSSFCIKHTCSTTYVIIVQNILAISCRTVDECIVLYTGIMKDFLSQSVFPIWNFFVTSRQYWLSITKLKSVFRSIVNSSTKIPYNGNCLWKKMFANFVNTAIFVNIFLLNFINLLQLRGEGLTSLNTVRWLHWSPAQSCSSWIFKTAVLEYFGRMTWSSNCKWVCPL